MSDETGKQDPLLRNDLSTADLAGAGDRPRRTIQVGPAPDGAAQREMETRSASSAGPGGSGAAAAPAREREDERAPLFSAEEARELRARWDSVQVGFVDEPRQAVESADQLVAAAMKRLAEIFADERQTLERQWDQGGDSISTEDLRLALRRYRSFFARLLSI